MVSYKSLVVLVALAVAEAAQDVFYPTSPKGFADIVGFGNGTYIALNSVSGDPVVQLASCEFGYNTGWLTDEHLRFVADATGDGRGDIVAFGNGGVYIAPNNGSNGFDTSSLVVADFGYDDSVGGWLIEDHPRFVVDLRRTGRVDILGFGNAGVYVSLNNGNLSFSTPTLVLDAYGYGADGGGWQTQRHLRFLADVNGDGYPDIVGFGEVDVYVSLGNGFGTFGPQTTVLQAFTINSGWTIDNTPRFLADLTGDGRVDIIGFADDGIYVSLNNGDGTFGPITGPVVEGFGINAGWEVDEDPRFIADINGDGRGDIVAFGAAGVYTGLGNGDGTFQTPQLVLADFGYNAGGWLVDQDPRFMADLNGDGMADIVGFGQDAVYVAYSLGNGTFTEPTVLVNDFGVLQGWSADNDVRNPANIYTYY